MRFTRRLLILAAGALSSCDPPPAKAPPVSLEIPAAPAGAPIVEHAPLARSCPGAEPRTLCGVVSFAASPPARTVPPARAQAIYCDVNSAPHDAVLVRDGHLADVLVRIVLVSPSAAGVARSAPVTVRQSRCQYQPRVSGALIGSTLEISNEDGTLHDVHVFAPGGDTWFNQAQPKGGPPIARELAEPGFVRIIDDVHPWKNGFVFVSSDPFFAVTDVDGRFVIPKLPLGEHDVEAWHSIYGRKRARVMVRDDGPVQLLISYRGDEPPPPENPVAERDRAGFP